MTTTTAARPWSPSDRDRMIYKWVKFDGHKQSWVADQLELNQSTVSRILDRYERWIAHGGPAQQGALNRDERLRAQVWLTYERNESIIASCMRLAGEMERMSDTTRSTTKHYCSEPSREIEVKTENSIRDNTAKAHRYLSLAHRVGKHQIELLEKHDLPALEPFTLDEHEYAQALADANPKSVNVFPTEFGAGLETCSEGPPSEHTNPRVPPRSSATPDTVQSPTATHHSPTHHSPVAPMPDTHNPEPAQSPLTPSAPIVSIEIAPHKNPQTHAYQVAPNPPEPTDQLAPILDATTHQPPPPIRILPIHMPLTAP